MRLRWLLLLLVLLICREVAAAPGPVLDGTFRLLQRRAELDLQLAAQGNHPAALRLSNLHELQLNQSEVGFQVYNFISGNYEYRPGLFVGEGRHCRLFVEKANLQTLGKDPAAALQQIVKTFDDRVYPTITTWFGEPFVPSEFDLPDGRIYIFLVDIRDNFSSGYVAGYFDHRDIEGLFGNQKPVFFMDINPGSPGNPSDKANSFYRTLAHEFQHMVSFSRRLQRGLPAQERWLDEGLSMFSEFVFSGRVGASEEMVPPSPHYEKFIENPAVNLFSSSNNSWFKEELLFRQYGASFLFTTYLVEKYGGNSTPARQSFTRRLIDHAESGPAGLDRLLAENGTNLIEAFQNWTLACYLNDPQLNQGQWHFASIKIHEDAAVAQLPLKHIRHYQARESTSFIGAEGQILPNSVNLEEISGIGKSRIRFRFAPEMTPALVKVNEKAIEFKNLSDAVGGESWIDFDLNGTDRFFVIPVAVKNKFVANEKLKYSFETAAEGLLLYPLANPAFNDQFIIFLQSRKNELVATPTLKITFNNLIDSPKFAPVNDARRIFVAHYRLPGNGKGQAVCHAGEDSCSFSFSAALTGAAEEIALVGGEVSLNVAAGSDMAGSVMLSESASNSAGTLPAQLVAGPFDLIVPSGLLAYLKIKRNFSDLRSLGLVQLTEREECKNWQLLENHENAVRGKVLHSGRYALVRDLQAPVLQDFAVVNSAAGCRVVARIDDDLAGIDRMKTRLFCENTGWQEPAQVNDDVYVFLLPTLPGGEQSMHIHCVDMAGNELMETRTQIIAGKPGMSAPVIYPNPARGPVNLRFDFSAPVDLIEGKVIIFDVSGRRTARLDAWQSGPTRIEATWDTEIKGGKIAANGIYFARITLQTLQGQFKSTGKIGLLR